MTYAEHLATCVSCLHRGDVCTVAEQLWSDEHRRTNHNPLDLDAEPCCPECCDCTDAPLLEIEWQT